MCASGLPLAYALNSRMMQYFVAFRIFHICFLEGVSIDTPNLKCISCIHHVYTCLNGRVGYLPKIIPKELEVNSWNTLYACLCVNNHSKIHICTQKHFGRVIENKFGLDFDVRHCFWLVCISSSTHHLYQYCICMHFKMQFYLILQAINASSHIISEWVKFLSFSLLPYSPSVCIWCGNIYFPFYSSLHSLGTENR